MNFNNLSKKFRYVNENGDSIDHDKRISDRHAECDNHR